MSDWNNKARVSIVSVGKEMYPKGQDNTGDFSMKGWNSYIVGISLKYMDGNIRDGDIILVVPPDSDYIPFAGDIVHIKSTAEKRRKGHWYYDDAYDSTNGDPNVHNYIRNELSKTELIYDSDWKVDMGPIKVYRQPDFHRGAYFYIRPVKVFFNSLTGEKKCEEVAGDSINLWEMFDQLAFTLFQRMESGKTHAIADFDSLSEAEDCMNKMRDAHKALKLLKQ